MGIYQRGMAVGDGGIVSPGQIAAKMDMVNAYFIGFNADVLRMGTPAFKAQWQAFKAAWDTFYRENRDSTWARWWGGTMTRVEEFERNLAGWRASFRQQGGRTTEPEPVGPVDTTSNITSILKGASILAGLIALGIVVSKFGSGTK